MELLVEYDYDVGEGAFPVAWHTGNETVQLFVVSGASDALYHRDSQVPFGQWVGLEFSDNIRASYDTGISGLHVKHNMGEVAVFSWLHSDEVCIALHYERVDISNWIESGSIKLERSNKVSSLSLTISNPAGRFFNEDRTLIPPGSKVTVLLSMGDSEEVPFGVFYTDRSSYSIGSATASIEARNTIGKLLLEQRFDEVRSFAVQNMTDIIASILHNRGVQATYIEPSSITVGMQFPWDMSIYDGIMELLAVAYPQEWVVEEKLDGTVVVGRPGNAELPQYGNYIFHRGTEVISRGMQREDREVYKRVCVYWDRDAGESLIPHVNEAVGTGNGTTKTFYLDNKPIDQTSLIVRLDGVEQPESAYTVDEANGSFTLNSAPASGVVITADYSLRLVVGAAHPKEYAEVEAIESWALPAHKTLYVQTAQGTSRANMRAQAAQIAEQMGYVGIVEEFASPFRGQLIPGDSATIINDNGEAVLLGIITSVEHKFGKNGFFTQFTVDSGGKIGKTRLSDLIGSMTGPKTSGQVERVY